MTAGTITFDNELKLVQKLIPSEKMIKEFNQREMERLKDDPDAVQKC